MLEIENRISHKLFQANTISFLGRKPRKIQEKNNYILNAMMKYIHVKMDISQTHAYTHTHSDYSFQRFEFVLRNTQRFLRFCSCTTMTYRDFQQV